MPGHRRGLGHARRQGMAATLPSGYEGATMRERDGLLRWSLIGPTLLLLIAFNVFPLCYNVLLSFTNAELVGEGARNVGGANYARIFGEPLFQKALRRTAVFVVCAVTAELLLGFALALALKKDFAAKRWVLTALLVPMMLSPA